MFNIQPGMGLGYQANKQMALGLGYAVSIGPVLPELEVTADKGGWVNPMEAQKGAFDAEDYQRSIVLKDDEDIFGIITSIILSGVLDE